jgi:hypothetical protein
MDFGKSFTRMVLIGGGFARISVFFRWQNAGCGPADVHGNYAGAVAQG